MGTVTIQHGKIAAIAVVGNGPVDPACRQTIDEHEFVVRFNHCSNFETSGVRTDALVFAPVGPTGAINASEEVHAGAIRHAKEFWFTRSADLIDEERRKAIAKGADTINLEDWTRQIIARHVGSRPYLFLDPKIYRRAERELAALGASEPFEPSSGVLALIHLRERFPRKAINLFGFTHEGWEGHSWEAERKLVRLLTSPTNT